jgi:hypothetical protein
LRYSQTTENHFFWRFNAVTIKQNQENSGIASYSRNSEEVKKSYCLFLNVCMLILIGEMKSKWGRERQRKRKYDIYIFLHHLHLLFSGSLISSRFNFCKFVYYRIKRSQMHAITCFSAFKPGVRKKWHFLIFFKYQRGIIVLIEQVPYF